MMNDLEDQPVNIETETEDDDAVDFGRQSAANAKKAALAAQQADSFDSDVIQQNQ